MQKIISNLCYIKWLLFIIILFSSLIQGQESHKYTHLKTYVGGDAVENVLQDEILNPVLKKIMGKEYRHLIGNLSVTGGVDFISGSIVVDGNAPHQGGSEMAILDINLYTGKVTAAIYQEGTIKIYSDKGKAGNNYNSVPISIKDWLAVISTNYNYRSSMPGNVFIK